MLKNDLRGMHHGAEVACTILLLSAALSASEIYTLDDCLKIATENNLKIKNADLDVKMYEETKSEAFTAYFPKIFAGAFAFAANDYLVKKNVDVSGMMEPLGGTLVSMGVPATALAGIPSDMEFDALDNGIVGHLTAVQPVFAGGKIITGNKLASLGKRAGLLQKRLSENEIRIQTETYYWQLESLKGKITTLDEADSQLANIHSDVKISVDAGVAVSNDLLRVELEQKKLKSDRLKVENGIKVLKLLLAQQMNLDNADFDIAAPPEGDVEKPGTFYTDADAALKKRNETELLNVQEESADLEYDMARGNYLPTLAVGASLLYNNLLGENNVNGVVFANLSVPISDWWGASHALSSKHIKKEQATYTKQQNLQLMKVDIEAKWNTLQEDYEQIALAKQTVAQAEENLRIQRDYYNAGTSSLSDLLGAQTLHCEALDGLSDATTTYYNAVSAYRIATGK